MLHGLVKLSDHRGELASSGSLDPLFTRNGAGTSLCTEPTVLAFLITFETTEVRRVCRASLSQPVSTVAERVALPHCGQDSAGPVVVQAVVDLDQPLLTPRFLAVEGVPELLDRLQSPDLRVGLGEAVPGERHGLACCPLLVLGPGPSIAASAGEAVP